VRDSSGAPFLGVLAEEKRADPGHAQDSSSVGMTKVEIMKILNLRRFENGED
jgi:hypothetical protein